MPKNSDNENRDHFMNEKKKKKKKRKLDYTALNENNYSESEYSSVSSFLSVIENEKEEKKKKKEKEKEKKEKKKYKRKNPPKKIFIQEEKKLILKKDESEEENFNKIKKKKKEKKEKFSIHDTNDDNEIDENRDSKEPRTTAYFIDKINRTLKTDAETIYVENIHFENNDTEQNHNKLKSKEAPIPNDIDVELEEIRTNRDNVEEENHEIEDENNDEEWNVFKKFYFRIKKVITERKGNPITNENTDEQIFHENENATEMCDLQISRNDVNENENTTTTTTNNNNRNISEQNEINRNTGILYNQTADYVFSNRQDTTRLQEGDGMISINEVNPNDVFDDRLVQNEQTEMRSLTPNNNDDNNDDTNTNESRFRIISPSNIVTNITTYARNIKEKIKKYWSDRVEEANIQNNTHHMNTNGNSENRESRHFTEDENDDPSCLQILFFFGLICKFPILWIIGSVIFCITPNEHKKTKRWSLINSVFAFLSILYFIVTSKIKTSTAGFMVFMNENLEPHFLFHKGLIKHNHVAHNFVILDKSNELLWICMDKEEILCKTGPNGFLDWNFIQTHKPTRNILMSKDVYKLLNRVQITVVFGKGNSYRTKGMERINHLLKNVKTDMEPIPYESLYLTDKEIPHDFFGCGLRCERADSGNEKWFLFWKEGNEATFFNETVPVGDIFFFKNEHNCKIAFIFPNQININEKNFPNSFVEIKRVLMKSF